jgi:glycosyltransferase involved in cell wall biosynthesis
MRPINLLTNAVPPSAVGTYAQQLADIFHVQPQIIDGSKPFGAKPFNWIWNGCQTKRALKKDDAIHHITNQSLSFLAKGLPRTVITVHDILEVTDPQTVGARAIYQYLYSGITRSQALIAVSQYTAKAVAARYGISLHDITVIPNGINTEFSKIDNFSSTIAGLSLGKELKIPEGSPVILYVGSEHPRKNVPAALRAFARLRQEFPTAVFIKVGEAGLATGRQTTLDTIDELGIAAHVRILNTISISRLQEMYNLANVFVFPSLAEGFGLPVLEAMACGTPVVTSNTTSLPEVAGDAALLVDPQNTEAVAKAMGRILSDASFASDLSARGLKRAQGYTWQAAAEKTVAVYKKLEI